MSKKTKILSLDGGGMKGYVTCVILSELERKTGKKCSELFDLISGTSIGGIVAGLISCGVPASEALTFFTEAGPHIFKKTWRNKLGGVFSPKYSDKAIESVLQSKFKGLSLKTNLLITSYDLNSQMPYFFKFGPHDSTDELWKAARATSSAQIFFPAFKTLIAGKHYVFWDGGNVANNPAVCAYAEAVKLWKKDPTILSIGTGANIVNTDASSMVNSGFIRNAIMTVSSLFQAGSEEVDYQLLQLISDDYIRIQPTLTVALQMDGAESEDLKKLNEFSSDFVKTKKCQDALDTYIFKNFGIHAH